MLPPVVLWIDPGLMTGLAWLWAAPGGYEFHADEFGFMEAGTSIESTCMTYGQNLWVGWERYTIDQRRPQTNAADAIEMIGVARRLATTHLCRILTPGQQHTPKPFDRERLQALGWWVPAKKDAQSAACHMMLWLLRTGQMPPRQRAVLDEITGKAG